MSEFSSLIRSVPDFPKPGILFRDVTPVLSNPQAFAQVTAALSARVKAVGATHLVGIESRGFIVGTALATSVRLGFVPVRKPGKLPGPVTGVDYALEYGTDRLEIQSDAFEGGARVLVVDDLLATGGTAAACAQLVTAAGGSLCGFAFVAELAGLGGRARLPEPHPVESLIVYS